MSGCKLRIVVLSALLDNGIIVFCNPGLTGVF